jgi:Coenzyme PQQ synthesis protein D (PqqD)
MDKIRCAPQAALRLGAGTRIYFDAGARRHVLIHCDAEVMLNAMAHFVLRLCDGGHTRHGILQRMGVKRGSVMARDIQAFLDEACALAWIVERRPAGCLPVWRGHRRSAATPNGKRHCGRYRLV